MQVHSGELQVLDLGQGGRHLLLQVLGLWIPEEERDGLWGSLLSQGAWVGGVLSHLLTLFKTLLLNHELKLIYRVTSREGVLGTMKVGKRISRVVSIVGTGA